MARAQRTLAAVLAIGLAASAATSTAAGATVPASPPGHPSGPLAGLLSSAQLWATIDVCNPRDQPYTVGVRGSMPGDGHTADRLYMGFRLQYLAPSKRWVNVAGASAGLRAIGTAAAARQFGTSFEMVPRRVAFTLRGVVEFQWRRGASVLLSTSRATSAGRHSLSGADPAGFSAATCPLR